MLWLTKAWQDLRARALWAAIFALVGLFASCAAPAPPPRTTEGVAAMLGEAAGGEVRPDDFVWEARGGFLADAVLGRQVLFLARKPGGAADLYRARVRLTRAGRPLSLRFLRNLTESPLGDEHDLVAQGHRAAYMTSAFGAVQGITLLDLDGEAPPRGSFAQRLAARIDRWISTGTTRGLARAEVSFATPPDEAKHEWQGDLLVMALGKEATPAAVDARDGALVTGPQNPAGASAQPIPSTSVTLGDALARAATALIGEGSGAAVRSVSGAIEALTASLRPAAPVDRTINPGAPPPAGDTFPPAALKPVARPDLPGEGAWTAAGAAQGRGAPGAPAFAYEAAIRPDPGAPGVLVRLWALDTRQVDLRLTPGVEEPRSRLGLHGTGRPPDGVPADRIVAAFAGGPAGKSSDIAGFIADRRVISPAVPGLPTVALADDGRVALGPWPFADTLAAPWISARQAVTPSRGPAERSALGLLPGGQIVYAWSGRATADQIQKALALAGCTATVPLAAGPAPAGFAYLDPKGAPAPAAKGMSISLGDRSPNDRFYVVLRSSAVTAPDGVAFAPDGGRQPAPAWLPAVQTAVVTNLGAQVHVTTFAPGRVTFHLRAGAKEPATKAVVALPGALPEADLARAVAAVGMGAGKRRQARGLWIDGAVGLPIRSDEAGVLALDHGLPRILRAAELKPAPGVDASEVPLTADEGKLLPAARDVGSMRARSVACVLADGTFAVAATTFDSDEAATTALLDLGCARVAALDRGAHRDAFVHRAGTPNAPQARYDATALYALEIPLSGRASALPARP